MFDLDRPRRQRRLSGALHPGLFAAQLAGRAARATFCPELGIHAIQAAAQAMV
ncbi:MAG: hypothetical protein V8S71_11250 [Oscillospiraceae bacterium]